MARLFQWSETHAIFVPEIDAEHRNLYRAGAGLDRAVAAGVKAPQLKEMVRAAVSAAEDHFAHEERLMRAAHYSGLAWHKQQHDGTRRRLKDFARRVEAGDKPAVRELLDFLAPWMRDHVGLADRMMGAYLRNQQRLRAVA
jgi:hemerythrin